MGKLDDVRPYWADQLSTKRFKPNTVTAAVETKKTVRRHPFKRIKITRKNALSLIVKWGIPVVITLVALFFIHGRAKADPTPPSGSQLATYLQSNQLELSVGEINGYDQVFYSYNGHSYQLTTDNYNHYGALSSGANIVWVGQVNGGSQIFEYNILNQSLIQLTSADVNEAPFISGNVVTWQSWDGNNWQIDYFDGVNTFQITNNSFSSINASTNGSKIIYAEDLGGNSWSSESYDISTSQTATISQGDISSAGYPRFNSDGSVSTNAVVH